MKRRIFPNFWQALLILVIYIVISTFFEVGAGLLSRQYGHSLLFLFLQLILRIIIFVLIIYIVAKKSNNKIFNKLLIPNFRSIIKIFSITLLLKFVLTIPLDGPTEFINYIKVNQIRIVGFLPREINLFLDLRMILVLPILEELLFRGLFLKQFLRKYSPLTSIFLSSLLFGIYHLDYLNFFLHLVFGVFLGFMYYKTNSVVITIIAHLIWNAVSLLSWDYINLTTNIIPLLIMLYLIVCILFFYLITKPIQLIDLDLKKLLPRAYK